MSRVYKATRVGLTDADSVQDQINYNPSTAIVSRKNRSSGHDGIHGVPGQPVVVSSFQCLIVLHERLSKGMIDLREPFGQEAKAVYVMITKQGTDINGNAISIEEGDFVFDGVESYLVDSVASFYFKNEAILEYVQ